MLVDFRFSQFVMSSLPQGCSTSVARDYKMLPVPARMETGYRKSSQKLEATATFDVI